MIYMSIYVFFSISYAALTAANTTTHFIFCKLTLQEWEGMG